MFSSIFNKFFQKEFLLYLLVGFATFGLDYFLYWFLLDFFNVWYLLAQVIVVPVVLAFNYFGHRKLTFSSDSSKRMQIKKYLVLATFNFIVSVSSLYLFVSIVGFGELFGKVCTMAIIVLYNYFALKLLVFDASASPVESTEVSSL